jgi:hypothetical protein
MSMCMQRNQRHWGTCGADNAALPLDMTVRNGRRYLHRVQTVPRVLPEVLGSLPCLGAAGERARLPYQALLQRVGT